MTDETRFDSDESGEPQVGSPEFDAESAVDAEVVASSEDAGGAADTGASGDAQKQPELSELDQARADAFARLDDARRIKADFDNYRKRMVREQTLLAERASGTVVEKLLPVLDAFRMALIAADRTHDYESLVRGVELVYGELADVMHKEGLEEIESDGKPFDPQVHDAVMESESSKPDGDPFVVDVMRTGYRFKGRVLRPAMVKVERR